MRRAPTPKGEQFCSCPAPKTPSANRAGFRNDIPTNHRQRSRKAREGGGRRDRLMPQRLQQQSEKSFLIFKILEIVNFPLCSDTIVCSLISNISADF